MSAVIYPCFSLPQVPLSFSLLLHKLCLFRTYNSFKENLTVVFKTRSAMFFQNMQSSWMEGRQGWGEKWTLDGNLQALGSELGKIHWMRNSPPEALTKVIFFPRQHLQSLWDPVGKPKKSALECSVSWRGEMADHFQDTTLATNVFIAISYIWLQPAALFQSQTSSQLILWGSRDDIKSKHHAWVSGNWQSSFQGKCCESQ